jgi:outer membrane protein W
MKTLLKSLLVFCCFSSLHGAAQSSSISDRDMAAFSWEAAFPTSNKFLNESTLKGWRFEYRKGVKKNLTVGIALSWNAFDEYFPTTTYATPSNSKAITTDMIRQVYTLPITLITHYYLSSKSKLFQPYIGVGLGAQYAEHTAYMNIYELSETNWGFVARPEVGTLLSFTPNSPVKVLVGVGYNISTNKNEAFNVDGWTHLTANLGISFGTAY